jgi:hypothetical protein
MDCAIATYSFAVTRLGLEVTLLRYVACIGALGVSSSCYGAGHCILLGGETVTEQRGNKRRWDAVGVIVVLLGGRCGCWVGFPERLSEGLF